MRDLQASSCPGLVSGFGFFENLFVDSGSHAEHYILKFFYLLFLPGGNQVDGLPPASSLNGKPASDIETRI